MNLLLDTHVLLWAMLSPETLKPACRAAIADASNRIETSIACLWEAAIKRRGGKLHLPDDWVVFVGQSGFEVRPILVNHALRAADLPLHHRDPFDRMIVAQAQAEGLIIATRDQKIAMYDVALFPA